MTSSIASRIRERAHQLGFAKVGFTPAGPLDHAEHFDAWIADGMYGEMHYMQNHRALRTDARELEPGTQTVIALALPYPHEPHASANAGAIARYALGDDYHDVARARMRDLAAYIHAETGAAVGARPAVDSAPLLERNVAVDAGIGWLAKSAMVIDQHIGSYFFLCELLTSLVIEETPEPHAPRCGTCTRCMDACPTGAIIGPHRVDARRCISYLTIELRGPIPRELRPLIGNHLFGCDICQSVCPWNRRADHEVIPELRPRPEVQAMQARAALQLSQTEFSTTFRKSPIKRTKRRGLARNAAVVLGNLADPDDAGLLQSAIRDHDEPLVRGHAAWALGQLALGQRNSEQRDSGQRAGANPGRTLDWVSTLRAACSSDAEAYVREEAHQALQAIQLSNVALEDELATTSDTDFATSTQLDSD